MGRTDADVLERPPIDATPDEPTADDLAWSIPGVAAPGEDRTAQVEAWCEKTAVQGQWFDAETADLYVRWWEATLVHTEGELAGRPFILNWWERVSVRMVFGWKNANGTRRFRTGHWQVPRKGGKTEFGAGMLLAIGLGDGEIGGQLYTGAVEEKQANLSVNKIATMIGYSPRLKSECEVFKKSIYIPALMTSIRPLSRGADSKHGFSPTGALYDELHAWPDGELRHVVHEGTGSRRQPFEIEITTAGERGKGYGWERHQHVRQVLDFTLADPTLFVMIFEAEEDDDWTDPAVWAKANPSYPVTPRHEFLASECAEAQASPRKEMRFRRYYLNQWTDREARWLVPAKWDACTSDPSDPDLWRKLRDRLAGRECYGGLDLAAVKDLNSLCWLFPPADRLAPGALWVAIWRFWMPRANIDARIKEDGVPFDLWDRSGAVTLTPGNVADYGAIEADIKADAEVFKVQSLGIDRWNATGTAVRLADEGLPVEMFGQGFASMSAPSKYLEILVENGALDHGGHPVAAWMARNVAVADNAAGDIKPDKAKSAERIDGIVALVEAIGGAISQKVEAKSYSSQFGVRVLR